jgi:O-antigen/teichoic acid export membrane protein
MLDLGFNITLTKRVAEYSVRGDHRGGSMISTVASTWFVAYLVIGLGAGLSLLVFALPGINVFHLGPQQLPAFRSVVIVLALQAGLGFPASVWNSVLCGLQEYHLVYLCSTIATIGRLIAAVVLLNMGIGVVGFAWIGLITAIGLWLSNYLLARIKLPDLRIRLRNFRWGELHGSASFSGSMMIWSVAGYSLHQGDRVILGLVSRAETVASYDIGARLAVYSRSIMQAWLDVLLPHAADSQARGRGDLGYLYLHATRILMFTYGAVVACVLVSGERLMTWWVGPGHNTSLIVLTLLVVANLFQSQTVAGHVLLVGAGKIRAFTFVMAAYPPMVGIVGLLLSRQYGAVGMAIGLLISVLLLETTFLLVLVRSLSFSLTELLRTSHLPLAVSLGAAWLLGRLTLALFAQPPLVSGLVGATVALIVYIAGVIALGTTREERARAVALLGLGRADE